MTWGKKLGCMIVFILCIVLAACSSSTDDKENANDTQNTSKQAQPVSKVKPIEKVEPKEPEVIEKEITLSAIGDMLIHSSVYEDAKVENGYDFMPLLNRVKPFLNDTTITFANQESMIGGEKLGLSTYPAFNSPTEEGDALKEVGVDVVSVANNHTLDRGEKAIQSAIEHWEAIDMMYTGAYKDEADKEKLRIYQTDEGISVAFLAYTYGTNGIPVPDGKDYLVNLIDREAMAKDIEKAKKLADVTVLSLHFGNEYERMPNDQQKDLVKFAADHGVNIVLGHHPHVLQPVAWVEGENGNKTFVAYSLGNFLSAQDEYYRQVGGIVEVTIKQTIVGDDKTIEVTSPKFMPTYVSYHNWSDYQVIPMFQLTNNELANASQRYQEIKDHMSQLMPELEFIEK